MNTTEVQKNLMVSPLFNLSLSSKELFHSNFLYWIGQQYPVLFRDIFVKLGCKADWINDDPKTWAVKREYENFDLCIKTANESLSFVLENKVKSIPAKSQLDRYSEKLGEEAHDLILLSLATAFPDRSAIEADGKWKICSYKELSKAIQDTVRHYKGQLPDYDKGVINDYCMFIDNLHQLSESWCAKKDSRFLLTKDDKEVCNALRIGDLQDKIWYSTLIAYLNEHLQESGQGFKIIPGQSIKDIKEKGNCLNEVFTNWGFTHGQGLLEAKVKVNDDYVLLIQLQGSRYCRAIEWIADKELDYNGFWKMTEEERLIKELSFFQFNKDSDISYPAICENANEPISMRKRNGKDGNFCKYGNKFLYQTKNIKDDATVSEVIDAIVKELESIVEKAKSL
ncbi:MAG: PD-(D/E)XK nuclease family protein [Prevotella sp.]|nr:PD-(D/E)XK nuclease family protein [Prevotella sp.]